MKKYLFILLWFLIPRKLSAVENKNSKLTEYLQEEYELVHKQLTERIRKSRQTNMKIFEPELLGIYQHSSDKIFDQHIFTFFNKTFFVIGDEIFFGTLNGTLNMDFYGHFKHKKSEYFKAFEYNQTGFLALDAENEILMYSFSQNSTSPQLIQEIFTPYFSSAIFFTNADSLYFASSTNRGEHISFIKIYKWLGSHFDEIETLHTTGAVTMDSFSYQNLEIIVIGQSLPGGVKVSSSVYEFKQDKTRKIQLLDTAKPTHMDIFFQNAVPYVLIYEDPESQTLYKWNGFEMVLVNRFQWEHKVDKSIVVYSNAIPLIVQPQLDKILVFKPRKDDIQLYQTRNYMEDYSIILDTNKRENENGNIIFIGGLNEQNLINIYAMSFKALTEIETEQEETLLKCFNNLEQKVYDRREKLNQTSNGRVEIPVAKGNNSTFRKKRDIADETDIENVLEDIKTRLNYIKPIIISYGNSSNKLIINGQAIIKSNIKAKKVEAKKLKFDVVNGKTWLPNQYLRYNQKQIVKGPVKISKIKTNILVANGDAGKLFQNLLRHNGNQHISGNFKINKLLASKIYTKEINGIEIDNIYKQGDSSVIKGVKSFKNMFAKKAYIDEINDKKTEEIIYVVKNNNETNRKFASNVQIDNLDVESIDKINWKEFEESVFKIGEDNFIEGNLYAPKLAVTKLQAKTINGIDTQHLMTTSTDQMINSTLEFNGIKAPSIKCETVNDIDITKAVRMDQNGTVIKGPVRIREIHVKNDLQLTDTPSSIKEGNHLFGTNHSDLLQRYLGKVVVNGNLYVNDLSTLGNTTIFFKGNEYTMDVLNEYWNKNGNQTIPVHFEATNSISAPHLNIKTLNNIPMENFALNLKNSQIRSPLLFKNVTVDGNVILKKSNFTNSLDLPKLALEGVKKTGQTYHIKGNKVFKKVLNAKVLETQANAKNIYNMFKKVIVKGDLIGNVHTDTINNINITQYVENLLPLKKPQNLTDLNFDNVTVEHLQVKYINGHNIDKFLDKLRNMIQDRDIKRVNIKGNITIQKVRDLKTINGHNIDDFYTKGNSQTDEDPDFTGDVKFTGKVKIENLSARIINNIDFPNLTKRHFYKISNQSVTGLYTFKNLKTVHLYAEKINDKNVSSLIDTSSTKAQQILAPEGVIFKNIKLEKSIAATEMVPCDINRAMKKIHAPETQEWAEVEISGNVTFLDENCALLRILKKSVKTGQENTILSPVSIQGHVLSEQVKIMGKLNDFNLSELIADVVLVDSEEEQIITGHKTFKNVINANTVTVLENADIPVLNKIISIKGLYRNIIKREDVNNITILGKKTFFEGLQCNKISAEKVAGIKPENIVSLTNLTSIPNALFDHISVLNNLNIRYINNHKLDYILNNRLFTNTTEKQITDGVYFFRDLEIVENLRTAAINNIKINDIVFDIKKQKITAPKRFFENVTVYGNIKVDYLNGINVTKAYKNALLLGDDGANNGSINILYPVRFEGNITVKTINGYPIEQIKRLTNKTSTEAAEKVITNTQGKIKTLIKNSLPAVKHMPNEFLYIEKSEDLQVEISNAIDASVTIIKDYALIHIISEESHEKCYLPEGCKCPVQHTVEITPHNSVNPLLNKELQRVYSYDDDTMTAHLTTNSISYSKQCRTNQTDKISETSTMTWTSTTTKNTTNAFHVQPIFTTGYISGAEFFTLNGVAYAVIAQYYDPIIDSHDLNCSVVRFNEDKTSFSQIQQIATHRATVLYLLHTAQGVILVIGNLAQKPYTEIYRFNENKQQFELMRIVNYGCSKAVGVVLGTDSLIVLANEEAPLQVLKYQKNWDNYYYYQMFALDESVVGMSVFYIGGFGISDAYLCIITEDNYRIYSFQYIDGWKLEARGFIRGLQNLIPFELNSRLYLFAPSVDESSLLRVVKHGTGET